MKRYGMLITATSRTESIIPAALISASTMKVVLALNQLPPDKEEPYYHITVQEIGESMRAERSKIIKDPNEYI
jgi:hypothetical protein